MKKILFLLLLSVAMYGQVPADATPLENIQITNNKTSITATKVNVQESDGTINTKPLLELANYLEFASAVNLPVTGEQGKLYLTKDNNRLYRFNGTIYQELADTDITNNLTYINVKSFGAKGDGITDDTANIQNALNSIPSQGGTLYFPSGKYMTTGGLIITKHTNLIGDNGNYSYDYTASSYSQKGSIIYSSSPTNVLFSSAIAGINIQSLSFVNNSSTSPTSGYGIDLTNAGFVSFENVSVVGFYDNVRILNSGSSVINNSHFFNPVRYNVFMANPIFPDSGDNSISNCHFSSNSMGLVTNLKYESGGGLKITNTKFNPGDGGRAKIHIDANMRGGSTSILLVANSSFEGFTDSGIKITATAPITYEFVSIQGSQFAAYTEMTGNYVQIMGEGLIRNVIVSNNIMVSTQTELERLPIRIDNVLTVIAKSNLFNGGSKGMYITNCTDVDTQEGDTGYIPKFKSNYAFVNSSIFSAEHGAGIGTENPLSIPGSTFFTVDGLNESGYIIRKNGVQSGAFSSGASGSFLAETRDLPLKFFINNIEKGSFSSSGLKSNNLAGTGDRNVVADADGTLKIGVALGSNAYSSTAYLPLSGGTVTGTVTATSYTATSLPVFENNAAASSLAVGQFYRTSIGVLMVKF